MSAVSGPPLRDALARVSAALERDGARFAFIGGIAVVAWGSPRTTVDIDVLVAQTGLDPERAVRALASEQFELRGSIHADQMLAGFSVLRIYAGASPVPVDVLVSTNPIVEDIMTRRRSRTLMDLEIPVPSAEDLIVIKLQAGRRQDVADADAVLRAQAGTVDLARLRDLAVTFAVSEALDSLLAGLSRPE